MKSTLVLAFTILAGRPAFAGLTYDFTSTTTGVANQTIAGSVKAEGKSMRIDIAKGDGVLFGNGSFVVSSDGGQTMNVVNPVAKNFYQLDLGALVGGADSILKQFGGNVKFDVRNPKVSVTGTVAGEPLAGFATKKSTVKSAYEIDVEGLGAPMTIRVQLTTDVWWTDSVSSDFTNFLQMRGLRTGMEAVDKLIAAEGNAIKGFPLKQITTTKVVLGSNEMTSTSTSVVSNVKKQAVAAATFTVPAGFSRTANPLERMVGGLKP